VSVSAKFVFTDGSAYKLYATDLGYWIEKTMSHQDKYHEDFETLFGDIDSFTYDSDELPEVKIENNILYITVEKKNTFKANIEKLSAWEKLVCNHPMGMILISLAAYMGKMWKSVFSKKPTLTFELEEVNCPEELQIPDYDTALKCEESDLDIYDTLWYKDLPLLHKE
jgi:hypothetical protein